MKRFKTPRGAFFLLLAVCCVLLAYYLTNLKIEKSKPEEYVKLTKDDNGNSFKEESLVDLAKRSFYIITVVKNNGICAALYKYKVPYDALLNFLNEFRITESNGKIIDIKRHVPEDLA